MDWRREVLEEAGRLGLARWERIVVVLLVAAATVLARRGVLALLAMPPGGPDPVENPPAPPMDLPIEIDMKEWRDGEP